MPVPVPRLRPTRVAFDTNVLMDLAQDDESVLDCLAALRDRLPAVSIVVSPTVIEELVCFADESAMSAERKAASAALANLVAKWRFVPFNCVPVGHGIVEETARKLRARQILPEEERRDSFIVVEAGLIGASILISSDAHIYGIDPYRLKVELDAADISTPLISSPWEIVKKFFR